MFIWSYVWQNKVVILIIKMSNIILYVYQAGMHVILISLEYAIH